MIAPEVRVLDRGKEAVPKEERAVSHWDVGRLEGFVLRVGPVPGFPFEPAQGKIVFGLVQVGDVLLGESASAVDRCTWRQFETNLRGFLGSSLLMKRPMFT